MKKVVKIIAIILIVLLLVLVVIGIKKNTLVKKVSEFSISNYEKGALIEKRHNSNEELYNSLSVYKYGEKWRYTINDKEIYFNENDKNMTIIENGTKTVQEKYEMNAGPQTYSEYLNWDSKNIFEKISYSFSVNIKEGTYEEKSVVVVSDDNSTWYFDNEEYFPIALESEMVNSTFEFIKEITASDVNFEEE